MNNLARNIKEAHGLNLEIKKYLGNRTIFTLMKGPTDVAYVILNGMHNGTGAVASAQLSEGRTNALYREKGYGKFLRALATRYALDTYKTIKYINQIGANYENIVALSFTNKHKLKLTPLQVRQIARSNGNVTNLAERYKVSENVVRNLKNHFEAISTKILKSLGLS